MTRRRGLLVLLALIATSLIVPQSRPVAAASADLQLIAQSFNIAADGSFTATLGLPPTMSSSDLATADVVVTVLQRVDKREDLLPIIDGKLVRPDDAVTISPGCCAGDRPDQFTVTVPLETTEVRPDALSVPRAGLYPVTIAVQRDGRVLTSVLSFLNRLPATDEKVDTDPISVGVAIGTHSAAHLDSNATISLDASTNAEMSRLADVLDALNAHKFIATVRIAPAVLNGLQQLNPSVFSRLIAALQSHQVVAEPQWPLDASAAAVAKQDVLYTSWRRDGQGEFASLGLGRSVVSTATVLTDRPISAEGASLRFRDGAELMVVSPQIYDGLDGSIQTFSDYKGELVEAKLPDDVSLDVAVVDHAISALLTHPLPTIEQTRIYSVADLLALRQKIGIEGASLSRHAVVIGAPNLDVPDPHLLGPIIELIAATPGLASARLDDIALHTDRLTVNEGDEAPVTLPAGNGDALKARIFLKATIDNEIAAVASMLPADSERPKSWRDLADLLPTTALDDIAAQGMATSIRAGLDEIRGAVQVPGPSTINLPGRRGTVRLRFLNNSDVPLQIKVTLSSPPGKLVFTNINVPIELEPGVPREIPISVEARSNGTSGVSLDVFTPNDVRLVDTIPLTFRVRALGVANVITGVLFGLVLLWWLEHLRSVRKKRRLAAAATLPAS